MLHPIIPPLNCYYSEDVIWQLCPPNSSRQKARLLHKPQSPWNPQRCPECCLLKGQCVQWGCTTERLHSLFSTSSRVYIHTVTHACAAMHINTVLKRRGCSLYFCVRVHARPYPAAVFLSTALRKHAGQLFRPSSVWWETRINTYLVE